MNETVEVEKVESCTHNHHGIHSMVPMTRWGSKLYCAIIALPGIGIVTHFIVHVVATLFGLPCP